MKIRLRLNYGIIILFVIFLASCSNDDQALESLALNAIDLEILEKCGDSIAGFDAVNCCIVIPKEVTTNGFYVGGAKYLVSNETTSYEPSGLTYSWKLIGEGMEIDDATKQMVKFRFSKDFKGGVIESKIFARDGSEFCSGRDTVYLIN